MTVVFSSSDGVGVGLVGIRVGMVGADCPVYCEIRSALLIARTGEQTRVRITTILIKRRQVFIEILPPSKVAWD